MATTKFPKGAKQGDYNGHPMVLFGDADKPPQFGKGKAAAIVVLADAKVDPELIRDVAVGFGMRKLKDVDAKLIVSGAKALIAATVKAA